MAVVPREVPFNPELLAEIQQDSQEIRRLLSQADRLLEVPGHSNAYLAKATQLIEDLCDRLAMHFTLEEAFGMLDRAIEVDPQLSRRAQEMRAEHAPLYQRMCALCESVERLRYHEPHHPRIRELIGQYAAFRKALVKHERRESRLILEALDREIAAREAGS